MKYDSYYILSYNVYVSFVFAFNNYISCYLPVDGCPGACCCSCDSLTIVHDLFGVVTSLLPSIVYCVAVSLFSATVQCSNVLSAVSVLPEMIMHNFCFYFRTILSKRKQRTHKITKIGDSALLCLFICNIVVWDAAYVLPSTGISGIRFSQ